MDRKELERIIVGPIATVPTPFDDDYEVDYGRMSELTKRWVSEGLVKGKAVIKVAAAMGEGPMLSDEEWPALLRTVVRAADDKAAIVCGLHYKDTKRTIEDAKRAEALGAHALQVCPPIFNLPSQDDLLDYYNDLSNAIDIGIMVYHTHWMSGGLIDVDTIMKFKDISNIVSLKWSNPEGVDYDEMAKFSSFLNIIDNGGDVIRCHQLGGRGYINLTAESYPAHDLKVWDLIENKKYDEARALMDSVDAPLRDFYNKISARSGGQGRLKKGLMALMGQPVGSSRPPSKPMNDEEMDGLREVLERIGWPVASRAEVAAAR